MKPFKAQLGPKAQLGNDGTAAYLNSVGATDCAEIAFKLHAAGAGIS
jgi:hypothetical protein